MSHKDVLFIVEGEVTEPNLIHKINSLVGVSEDIHVYPYRTSIYELYDELVMDENLDVALLLRSKATDKSIKEMLSKDFVAIYLVFDFEPHYHKFSIEKIIRLRQFFDDSLSFGLLLINYPMIESYKHVAKMPDKCFLSRAVTRDEIRRYKAVVGLKSAYTNLTVYHRETVFNLIVHHLIKMNLLLLNTLSMPRTEEIDFMIRDTNFIHQQHLNYLDDKLYVLSTIFYYLIELKPKSFYDEFFLPIVDDLCR